MLKLDNNLLDELGLGSLPEDQKRSMLQHIYETLELRVGTNLANQMTDQQLEEFEKFIDEGGDANQAEALKWLETNLPNYKQVVNEVFEALKVEVKQMAPQLVAASMQPPAAMPQQAQPAATDLYAQPQQYAQPMPQQQPTYQQPTPMQDQGSFGVQQPHATPQPISQPVANAYTQPVPQPPVATPYAQPAPMPQQPYPPLATTGQSDDQQQAQAADAAIAQQQQPFPTQSSSAGGYQPAPQGFQPPQPPAQ